MSVLSACDFDSLVFARSKVTESYTESALAAFTGSLTTLVQFCTSLYATLPGVSRQRVARNVFEGSVAGENQA